MPKIVIVDANSVGYAGQHAADLKSGEQPTQAIYNTLNNLKKLKSSHRSANFLYLWDDRAKFRLDLLPDYKAKRSDTPEKAKVKEEYHSQQPFIKKALDSLGIPQVKKEGYEADDIAYYLVKSLTKKGYEIVLVTSDKDWLQMIGERVTWYDPRFDRTCTIKTFEEFTGYKSIRHFVESKSIIGDKSDNVEGIKGLGEKACQNIFNKWDSVVEMIKEHRTLGEFTKENIGSEFSRQMKKLNALCANTDGLLKQYQTNTKVMDLSKAPPIDNISIERPIKDEEAFYDLCLELSFHSIIKRRGIWSNMFFEAK